MNGASSTGPVRLTRDGAVLIARMSAPEYRNALSAPMKEALVGVAATFAADRELCCLVLTGCDGIFCAGGDLRDMADKRGPLDVQERMGKSHALVEALAGCGKPIVTAVNGAAVGAGLSLALLGDLVVASDGAWFQPGFSRVGVLPDLGLLYHLPRAVGMPTAKDLLLTNRRLQASEALACGLVSRVLATAAFDDAVLTLARDLAHGPTFAFGLTKNLLDAGWCDSLRPFLSRELLAQASVFATDDFVEGNRAFREKRPPRFQGR